MTLNNGGYNEAVSWTFGIQSKNLNMIDDIKK